MLGQFSGKNETNGGLNFARSNGRLLVVASQVLGLGGDLVKDILHTEKNEKKKDEKGCRRFSTMGGADKGSRHGVRSGVRARQEG